jgi:cell wall-associated NlpC family hydrolase
VQSTRTTTRRRSRALLALTATAVAVATGLLAPGTAAAGPRTAAEASALVRQTAQQLAAINEQLRQAEDLVEAQQAAAAVAAQQAADAHAAVKVFEPQLRAIAQSGYTTNSRSRVAAFLTSGSAGQLVQRMTTLDAIAARTNSIIVQAAAAQTVAQQAQAAADQAAATARAGLDQLAGQKAEVQKKVDAYQADFTRLSTAEQAQVTTAVAGRALTTPSLTSLPSAPGPKAALAIKTALAQVGDRYQGGATGPDAFDCSGLTSYAYAAAGLTLPRSSVDQSKPFPKVSRADLQPGDLVFYYTPISHVALYIGNGMIVHARTYGSPVAVTSVDQGGYRFAVRPPTD